MRKSGTCMFGAGLAALFSIGSEAATPADRQTTYNAAQAALDRGDWVAAADGFESLLPSTGDAKLSHSNAIIAARLASALTALNRYSEAAAWAQRATASLSSTDPYAAEAWLAAAEAARFMFDYKAASADYLKVIDLGTAQKDSVFVDAGQVGLTQAGLTVEPVRTAAAIDAFLAEQKPGTPPLDQAALEEIRALAAINAGDKDGATHWIERALQHSGGGDTTTHVTVLQADIRADAAIIYRLRGNEESARRYTAFTGAGHMKNMDWISAYSGQLPVCGVDGDVKPDDSVVVQFGIADDGRVNRAAPIYASRPGEVGQTFARAVSTWRWSSTALKGVEPFWRSSLRLELRCISRPAPKSLGKTFYTQTGEWLRQQGLITKSDEESIGDPQRNVDFAESPSPLVRMLMAEPVPKGMSPEKALTAALHELDAAHAPAAAYAILVRAVASARGAAAGSVRGAGGPEADMLSFAIAQLAARFPTDPAIAWLRLERALQMEDAGRFNEAGPVIAEVLAAPSSTLPDDDPIRKVALLHAALIKARQGDVGAAQAAMASSGLNADQCSLFDTHPVPQSVSMASSDFPSQALNWGFEGHVEEAFDIEADGRVSNVRTVLAYPPFIFGPSTETAVRRFRYIPPRIDGKAVGCSSMTQRVNYRMP